MKIFRGISYARYNRFEPAVEEAFIPGVSEYEDKGCFCPQSNSRISTMLMGKDSPMTMEEGSLCLSIYAPDAPQEGLPVMVWIHGGAYMTGGSEDKRYGAERLVERGDLIVVRISYRLGAFGYLWLPEEGIANLGLQDQQTALNWIRRNIAHFGGDPDNITVFGQSAGAHSIASLIASCKGKAPFRKAILQSPPLGITITPEEAAGISAAFLKHLGKDIYEASVEEILEAQNLVRKMKRGMCFMPVLPDNTYCPKDFAASGVKIIVGYNAQDSSVFLRSAVGDFLYSIIGGPVEKYLTRKIFAEPTIRYAERLRAAGAEAENYLIEWYPKGNALKSCHCIELPFLFGQLKDWVAADMLRGMTKEEFHNNSKKLSELWTTFAKTGNFPGGKIL